MVRILRRIKAWYTRRKEEKVAEDVLAFESMKEAKLYWMKMRTNMRWSEFKEKHNL